MEPDHHNTWWFTTLYPQMWGRIEFDWWTRVYALREAGNHTTSTLRMRGERGDLGMDPHTDSLDTKHGPEAYTQGMAPSSLFQTMDPTKTSGNTVAFGEYGFLVVNQRKSLSVLDCTDLMRRTRWKMYQDKNRMWWETIRRYSTQAWNTAEFYGRDEQQAREVITCTYYAGLQNWCSHTSCFNPSACTHESGEQECKFGNVRFVTTIGKKCILLYFGTWLFIWNY